MGSGRDCFPRGCSFSFSEEKFPSGKAGKPPQLCTRFQTTKSRDKAQAGGSWRVREDLTGDRVILIPNPNPKSHFHPSWRADPTSHGCPGSLLENAGNWEQQGESQGWGKPGELLSQGIPALAPHPGADSRGNVPSLLPGAFGAAGLTPFPSSDGFIPIFQPWESWCVQEGVERAEEQRVPTSSLFFPNLIPEERLSFIGICRERGIGNEIGLEGVERKGREREEEEGEEEGKGKGRRKRGREAKGGGEGKREEKEEGKGKRKSEGKGKGRNEKEKK